MADLEVCPDHGVIAGQPHLLGCDVDALSQIVASGNLPESELCSLIEAYPELIGNVPSEQMRGVLICIAMNQNVDALEEARKRGLITPQNAMELFLESTQYGAKMPATQWFTDHYRFDPTQAQHIIENMEFPDLDALVVMAKKLPLSEKGQRDLLRLVDLAASLELGPLSERVSGNLFGISVRPGQYPLLYNYRGKAFR